MGTNITDFSPLERIAKLDPLTGLANRNLMNEKLNEAIEEADQTGLIVALMFIDLDRFKEVNDTMGHHAGDAVLIEISARLKKLVLPTDTIARLGGDEFAIIFRGLETIGPLSDISQNILKCINKPIAIGEVKASVGGSIGIAFYPLDESDSKELLKSADMAMYQAKADGRNCFRLHSADMKHAITSRLALKNDLHHALERNEFYLHYQPILGNDGEDIIGVETLLRWNNSKHPNILTSDIISIIESNDTICAIGEWVLRTACTQFQNWVDNGFDPGILSVNISVAQVKSSNFVNLINEIIYDTNIEPGRLDLEITESISFGYTDDLINKLREIHSFGISISIDDFGMGYSNFSYLQKIPAQRLKIDNSFIHSLSSKNGVQIVSAIIALANSLGLFVIAEGVESGSQFEILKQLKCQGLQGFFFYKPMSGLEMEQLMNDTGRKNNI